MSFKVLHIITSLTLGGAEKLLETSLPLYEKKGVDIYLVVLTQCDPVLKLNLERKLKNPIKVLNRHRFNPKIIIQIHNYIKEIDCRIIHAHLFPPLYYVAFIKKFLNRKINTVFTEHSPYNFRREVPLKYFERKIYARYDKIVCITDEVKLTLYKHLKNKVTQSKISVIENGIELNTFAKSKNLDQLKGDFKILQVSSFRPAKDQLTLIKAIHNTPDEVKLFLVGEGPQKHISQELVNQLNLSHRVFFLGKRNDVPALLKECDIVVQSSNWEGFGIAALEGMASKKPVIASNIPGLNSIVGGAGLLFNKGDDLTLAKHICNLYNDKNLRNEIAQKCYLKSKNYSIDFMVLKYIEIYENL